MPRGAALSVLVGDDWGDDDAALDDFLVMRVDVEESEARRENADIAAPTIVRTIGSRPESEAPTQIGDDTARHNPEGRAKGRPSDRYRKIVT
jgi:hypothetical protein